MNWSTGSNRQVKTPKSLSALGSVAQAQTSCPTNLGSRRSSTTLASPLALPDFWSKPAARCAHMQQISCLGLASRNCLVFSDFASFSYPLPPGVVHGASGVQFCAERSMVASKAWGRRVQAKQAEEGEIVREVADASSPRPALAKHTGCLHNTDTSHGVCSKWLGWAINTSLIRDERQI